MIQPVANLELMIFFLLVCFFINVYKKKLNKCLLSKYILLLNSKLKFLINRIIKKFISIYFIKKFHDLDKINFIKGELNV